MALKNKYFGTDGIRGRVGEFPITVEFIMKLGWAVGKALPMGNKVMIGKDTRISGYMIESALEAGLSAAGCNIQLLGPMPTSAIAYLTKTLRAEVGIVISASHNSANDNGIKFFSAEGFKLSSDFEQNIERLLEQDIKTVPLPDLGRAWRVNDAAGRYIEFCKSCIPHKTSLKHFKIVLDCANGATYHIAPAIFSELGAEVIPMNTTPNGLNINVECGATYPAAIQRRVVEEKADVGIAFDGDGDRVIMVDHLGEILDGDDLLYVVLKGLIQAKRFSGGVVGTYLSNMGLELALNDLGIHFFRVPIGDQNIIQALLTKSWSLGGEPSGHVIYLPVTTTADGIITALQALQTLVSCGLTLHEVKKGLRKFPQKLSSIRLEKSSNRPSLESDEIKKIIHKAEMALGRNGRVLIRYSGTEPLLRVMVEGENEELVDKVSEKIILSLKMDCHVI